MDGTKPWWQSKTMWAGLVGLLFNTYAALAVIFPDAHFPAVPAWVITIIDALLGGGVMAFRKAATTVIE